MKKIDSGRRCFYLLKTHFCLQKTHGAQSAATASIHKKGPFLGLKSWLPSLFLTGIKVISTPSYTTCFNENTSASHIMLYQEVRTTHKTCFIFQNPGNAPHHRPITHFYQVCSLPQVYNLLTIDFQVTFLRFLILGMNHLFPQQNIRKTGLQASLQKLGWWRRWESSGELTFHQAWQFVEVTLVAKRP